MNTNSVYFTRGTIVLAFVGSNPTFVDTEITSSTRTARTGVIVHIRGLILPREAHSNENYGKVVGEGPPGRFHVVPFTISQGRTRVYSAGQRSVRINQNNLLFMPKDDVKAEYMKLYIAGLTSKLNDNRNYEGSRAELEELHGLVDGLMPPLFLFDLARECPSDQQHERACFIY